MNDTKKTPEQRGYEKLTAMRHTSKAGRNVARRIEKAAETRVRQAGKREARDW